METIITEIQTKSVDQAYHSYLGDLRFFAPRLFHPTRLTAKKVFAYDLICVSYSFFFFSRTNPIAGREFSDCVRRQFLLKASDTTFGESGRFPTDWSFYSEWINDLALEFESYESGSCVFAKTAFDFLFNPRESYSGLYALSSAENSDFSKGDFDLQWKQLHKLLKLRCSDIQEFKRQKGSLGF